jgi:hypothetical protein
MKRISTERAAELGAVGALRIQDEAETSFKKFYEILNAKTSGIIGGLDEDIQDIMKQFFITGFAYGVQFYPELEKMFASPEATHK